MGLTMGSHKSCTTKLELDPLSNGELLKVLFRRVNLQGRYSVLWVFKKQP